MYGIRVRLKGTMKYPLEIIQTDNLRITPCEVFIFITFYDDTSYKLIQIIKDRNFLIYCIKTLNTIQKNTVLLIF